MLKFFTLAAGLMLASAAPAQQSLQSLHARVPVPPATAAAAPAWLVSPELLAIQQQIKDQRAFIESLMKNAGAAAMPAAGQTSGIDFQRAQRDPEYARECAFRILKTRLCNSHRRRSAGAVLHRRRELDRR